MTSFEERCEREDEEDRLALVASVSDSFGDCEECGTFGVDTDFQGADGRSVCDDCREHAR